MDASELVRQRRRAHGLTQAQLALRAGTTQAAVSRLERGHLSPTLGTLQSLLAALGEEPQLTFRSLPGDHDADHLTDLHARTPEQRFALAISWNRLAGEVALAGRRARA